MVFVAVGAAIGTLLALLRRRVLLAILVTTSYFFAIVVALCGLLLGYHLGLSALVGFESIAAVPGLLPGPGFTSIYSPQKMLCLKYRPQSDNSCALKFEVPCDLPPEMASLVLRLKPA